MMEISGHKVLSAEDLLVELSTKKQQRVPVVGAKFLSHSPPAKLLSADLERFYADRRCLLSEEKVDKTSRLGEGTWLSEAGVVQLTRPLGRAFQRCGHVRNGAEVLYPEEALFLMESRHLIVTYHGLPLSVQDAYKSLLKTELEINSYHVYSHLRRLGYVVLRHSCDTMEADDSSQAISDNDEVSGIVVNKHRDDGDRLQNAVSAFERVASSCTTAEPSPNVIGDSSAVSSRIVCVGTGVDTRLVADDHDDTDSPIVGSSCSKQQSAVAFPADSCTLPTGTACRSPVADHGQGDGATKCLRAESATEVVAAAAAIYGDDLCPPTKRLRTSADSEALDETHSLSSTVTADHGGSSYSCFGDAGALSERAQQQLCPSLPSSSQSAADNGVRTCDRTGDSTALAAALSAPYYHCSDFMGSPATLDSTAVCWDFSSVVLPGPDCCGNLKVTGDVQGSPGEHIDVAEPELSTEVAQILSEYLPAVGDFVCASYDASDMGFDELPIFDLPSWWPLRRSAATWPELKAAAAASRLPRDERPPDTTTTASSSGDALGDVLHSACDTEPLAGPRDAVCHSMLFNKLDIVRPLPDLPGTHSCLMRSAIAIVFDVFKPCMKFRKSSPGMPHLQVCIASAEDCPPTLAELCNYCCSNKWQSHRDICWAIVDNGAVSVFSLTNSFVLPDPL